MKILALYPGLAKAKNDVAQMLIELSNRNVGVSVIAARPLTQKGKGMLPPYEDMSGVSIHRIFNRNIELLAFPQAKLKQCLRLAAELKPDLIFCSQELNMRLALQLQKFIKVPIVLLVEDAGRLRSGETYKLFRRKIVLASIGFPIGSKLWTWCCKNASTIITCHPRDRNNLDNLSQFNKPIYYLPWPTYLPPDFQAPSEKKKYRGIFVGSLKPEKNTQEFETTLPRIIKETCTKEFIVIGPGPHAKLIQKLQKDSHGAVKHFYGVARNEALRMIAESHYAYTPVAFGGWGFIGDCWSVKTPLITSHSDNYVTNNVNALVSKDYDSLISNINRLYDSKECYETLTYNGFEESTRRTAKAVANELCNIFQRTIDDKSNLTIGKL